MLRSANRSFQFDDPPGRAWAFSNGRTLGLDVANRLSAVKQGGAVTMYYAYNGRGERVHRHLGSDVTYSMYDEAGHWIGDYNAGGAPKQQAIWLDDLPVGLLDGVATTSNRLHYIEPDHLGTPRAVIEPQRDVAVWTWDIASEAFGNSAPNQDPDGDSTAFVLDMRFPGQRYDAASGLNYNYFRDYEAGTGRYSQSDPIGLDGGMNTYAYVGGSPLDSIDPYGESTIVLPPWVQPIVGPKQTVVPRPIVTPIDSAFPIPFNSPMDPNGDFCRRLAERIHNSEKEIYEKRWPDLENNPKGLPWRIGPGEGLRETRRGHERILNRRLRELRGLEDEWYKKCAQRASACSAEYG